MCLAFLQYLTRKSWESFVFIWIKLLKNKTGLVNDPLGQPHSRISSRYYFRICYKFLKIWTDGRVDQKFREQDI